MARERGTAPSALAEIECDVCAFYYDERVSFGAKLQQRRWDEQAAERAAKVTEEQRRADAEDHYQATGRVKF